MHPDHRRALENDFIVDITTVGRTSGEPSRIEIWMLHLDGRFFITGTPGPRDWLANLRVNADLIVHLKQRVNADVAAISAEVHDVSLRRWVFEQGDSAWYRGQCTLDELIEDAPMVELTFRSE